MGGFACYFNLPLVVTSKSILRTSREFVEKAIMDETIPFEKLAFYIKNLCEAIEHYLQNKGYRLPINLVIRGGFEEAFKNTKYNELLGPHLINCRQARFTIT